VCRLARQHSKGVAVMMAAAATDAHAAVTPTGAMHVHMASAAIPLLVSIPLNVLTT